MSTAQTNKQKYITQIPTKLNGIYQLYNTARKAVVIAQAMRYAVIFLMMWNILITGYIAFDKITTHQQQKQAELDKQIAIQELIPLEPITE